jgi:hypothetical protein
VALDVQPLDKTYEDKRQRTEFTDGEIAEVRVLLVSECIQHKDSKGITHDLISTDRPDCLKKGSAYWADAKDIKNFEVVGD